MTNLQFKTNSLKIDSSVPSISLNYGRNLAKRPFAGSGKRNSCRFLVRNASGIYIRCITGICQSSESGSHAGEKSSAGVEDEVLRLAEKGHNILLTCFPGKGKTKQVNIVNKLLHVVGRRVAVTSTTGIIYSQTVHRFCGLKDGKFTNEDLVNLMNSETHKKQKDWYINTFLEINQM